MANTYLTLPFIQSLHGFVVTPQLHPRKPVTPTTSVYVIYKPSICMWRLNTLLGIVQ